MIGMSVREEMILSRRGSIIFGRAANMFLIQLGFRCKVSSKILALRLVILVLNRRTIYSQRKWNKLVRGPRSEAIDPNTREFQDMAV